MAPRPRRVRHLASPRCTPTAPGSTAGSPSSIKWAARLAASTGWATRISTSPAERSRWISTAGRGSRRASMPRATSSRGSRARTLIAYRRRLSSAPTSIQSPTAATSTVRSAPSRPLRLRARCASRAYGCGIRWKSSCGPTRKAASWGASSRWAMARASRSTVRRAQASRFARGSRASVEMCRGWKRLFGRAGVRPATWSCISSRGDCSTRRGFRWESSRGLSGYSGSRSPSRDSPTTRAPHQWISGRTRCLPQPSSRWR